MCEALLLITDSFLVYIFNKTFPNSDRMTSVQVGSCLMSARVVGSSHHTVPSAAETASEAEISALLKRCF